jgi:hypothetical protein
VKVERGRGRELDRELGRDRDPDPDPDRDRDPGRDRDRDRDPRRDSERDPSLDLDLDPARASHGRDARRRRAAAGAAPGRRDAARGAPAGAQRERDHGDREVVEVTDPEVRPLVQLGGEQDQRVEDRRGGEKGRPVMRHRRRHANLKIVLSASAVLPRARDLP